MKKKMKLPKSTKKGNRGDTRIFPLGGFNPLNLRSIQKVTNQGIGVLFVHQIFSKAAVNMGGASYIF